MRRIAGWPTGGANAIALAMARERHHDVMAECVARLVDDGGLPADLSCFLASLGVGPTSSG